MKTINPLTDFLTKSYSPVIATAFIVIFMIINAVLQTAGFTKPLIYITLVFWNKNNDFKK